MALKSTKKEVIARIKAYIIANTETEITEAIEWANEHPQNADITEETRKLYEAGDTWGGVFPLHHGAMESPQKPEPPPQFSR